MMSMKELDSDIEKVSGHLVSKQSDFDKAMQMSRELVREAGQAITLMHNDEKKKALDKLCAMAGTVGKLMKADAMFKYNTLQAYQEYAEAFIFINIKTKHKIPNMKSVGVDEEAYLLGLMDVEGELKREILESLRANKMKDAEWYFDTMKEIYDSTRRLRFAEAVLNGFRKKQDVARIQIENAGSEILMFKSRGKR
jgi:translin